MVVDTPRPAARRLRRRFILANGEWGGDNHTQRGADAGLRRTDARSERFRRGERLCRGAWDDECAILRRRYPARAGDAATERAAGSAPAGTAPAGTAPAAPSGTPSQVVKVTASDGANVRDKPDTNGAVVAMLEFGAEAPVLEANVTGADGASKWVHVSVAGKTGYIRSDLITGPQAPSPTQPPAPTATPKP